ncbi:MAG: 3-hydroxy-3-methylglutaryl CoA synthase, partial [Dehalococcoidia bacterium]
MVGIVSYGAYVPLYRLERKRIAEAWGGGAPAGEKAVANDDEDSLTMGVAAAFDCLGNGEEHKIDAVFFASTTPPYREKQSASILASVLDVGEEALTIDFGNSLRAGT